MVSANRDGKPVILAVNENGVVKLRIEPIADAADVTMGATGKMGKGKGRWIVARYLRKTNVDAVVAYNGKTGKQLWMRDDWGGSKFQLYLPTSVYDYDKDGCDDLLAVSRCFYGVISVKDNRLLVPPFAISNVIPGHWGADATPMLVRVRPGNRPQLFFSRAYALVRVNKLAGGAIWHYGVTKDTTPRHHPGLADMDGDGFTEIVIAQNDGLLRAFNAKPLASKCPTCPQNKALTAMNHAGKERWTFKLAGPVADIASADLDGDGKEELVCGTDDGKLIALKERKRVCEILWSVDLGRRVGSPVLADLDGDGKAEILVTTEDGYLHCLGEK